MSELKATTVYDAYWKANSTVEGTDVLVYLKSEADKVIAEKDKQIANMKETEVEIVKAWIHRCSVTEKRELHHKFKRCFAMARWCMTEYIQSKCLDFTNTEQWYWRRWHIRWRELAKEFKEAK